MQNSVIPTNTPRIPPAWLWALLYFVALLFIAPSPDIRHADDYHYLEASLQMTQGGDWLVPQTPDGEPRLRKPVFSYWPLALSLETLGHSMLAARLPYLLAGALTIWLIGALGARLVDLPTGRLAAMMTAACLPWLMAGLRTIPDVWLCLFTTLAAGGFLLRLSGEYREGALWLAWSALGLAAATKGLAALLVLAPAWAASRAVTPDAWRRLLHGRAMALSAVVGLGWYLVVAVKLGPESLLVFGRDQLHATLTANEVLGHAATYLLYLLLALLPWSVLAVGVGRADWRGALEGRHGRLVVAYALAYTIVLIGVFSFAYQFSGGRYLLPALPWLALTLALGFRRAAAAGRPNRWLRGAVVVLTALLILAVWLSVGALTAALGLVGESSGQLGRIIAITVAVGVVLIGTRIAAERALAVLALLVLLFLPLLFAQLRPALPGSARAIAAAAGDESLPGPVLMADEGSLAGVVRILSGGRVAFTAQINDPPAPGSFGTLIIAQEHLPEDAYPGCERRQVAMDYRRVDGGELLQALREGRGETFLERHRQPYLMVLCPGPSKSPVTSSR